MKPAFNLESIAGQSQWLKTAILASLTLLIIASLAASPVMGATSMLQQPAAPDNPNWTLNVVDGPPMFYNMSNRSLRYTSAGVPCIAYGADHLYYNCFDTTLLKWVRETVDATNQVGQYASLAFSTSNSPRISYYDAVAASLKFAYKIGNTWYTMTVDTPSDGNLPEPDELQTSPAMQELRRMSQPRLPEADPLLPDSYADSLTPEATTAGGVGLYSTIAVGTDNVVHIAYYDGTTGDLKHARYDGANWKITVVDGSGGVNIGSWPTIALNSNNFPRISYMDEKYDDLKYAEFDGVSWSTVTVDSTDPLNVDSVGPFTSLALDSSGNPHISYLFNGSPPGFTNKALRYAVRKSGVWTVEDLDYGNLGWDTSIGVDSNGVVHISYYNFGSGDLKYLTKSGKNVSIFTLASSGDVGRYTSLAIYGKIIGISYKNLSTGALHYIANGGSGWNTNWSVDVATEVGLYTSLATNQAGKGMITYFDETNDDVKIAQGWGPTWQLGILDGSNSIGPYSSAKYNSKSEPQIAYYDLTNGDLKFAYWYNNAWKFQTVASSNTVGQFVSLAIDGQDRPHVAYYHATNQDLVYAYANWDATNLKWVWAFEGPVDSVGDVGQYASLGLDANGKPHIAYYDATKKVLKYAFKSMLDAWVVETVDNTAHVGKFASLAVSGVADIYITYYDETLGDLKFAKKVGGVWAAPQAVDSTGNVGQYTSLAFDKLVGGHVSYYDVTNGDLKYAYYNKIADTWTVDPLPLDSGGNVGLFTSLAINSSGQIGISYYDYTNADLKFAGSNSFFDPIFLPLVIN
ncbi:MAG: exported protein of unknown function [Chloroflexi bacterium]|nr:exported protein of unknown function [Chloroflexota bacterium]